MSDFHALDDGFRDPKMQKLLNDKLPGFHSDEITFAVTALAAAKYAEKKLPDTGQSFAVNVAEQNLDTAIERHFQRESQTIGQKSRTEICRSISNVINDKIAEHIGRGVTG